jgi:hypothetical protein
MEFPDSPLNLSPSPKLYDSICMDWEKPIIEKRLNK